MYGIINKSIEEFVITNYGQEKWEQIRKHSGIEIDFFISNEPYPDEVTFKLASTISSEMGLPLDDVLHLFGEWWVLHTVKTKYGALMTAGGETLQEFIHNLPTFHSRIMLIYPKLNPPDFLVSDINDDSIHLEYISHREGLQSFVIGLISGLGKLYDTKVTAELVQHRSESGLNDIFKVSFPS